MIELLYILTIVVIHKPTLVLKLHRTTLPHPHPRIQVDLSKIGGLYQYPVCDTVFCKMLP